MNKTMHNKSSLFLMELIISILFFSVAGAVCVQLFVKAHLISKKSTDINNSCLWTQNICEVFTGEKGNLYEIAGFYSDNAVVLESDENDPDIGIIVLFFDDDWQIIDFPSADNAAANAAYEVMLKTSRQPASVIYADTSYDTSKMTGDAILGEIAVISVPQGEIKESFPDPKDPGVISFRTCDYYIN